MAQYIDKSALVAEIERRISQLESKYKKLSNLEIWITAKEIEHKINGLKEALLIINSLEVKEVDLEKEYKDFVEEDPVYNKLVNGIVGKAIAKHFFELGLKAQKGK